MSPPSNNQRRSFSPQYGFVSISLQYKPADPISRWRQTSALSVAGVPEEMAAAQPLGLNTARAEDVVATPIIRG
jgi:hypothetical protein